MVARAEVMQRPRLRALPDRVPNEVVAVVLSDGSVRELRGTDRPGRAEWTNGSISGPDWVLWWERRRFGSQS